MVANRMALLAMRTVLARDTASPVAMTTHNHGLRGRAYNNLRQQIFARDHGLCQIRGPRCSQYATQIDHIVALADGGAKYDKSNLRAACMQCNAWLAANRTNALRYRVSTARYETRL